MAARDAGELRTRVTIQSEVQVADSGGGAYHAWSTVATTWAKVEPLSGRELLQAEQLQSEVTHLITIRYRSGLHAGMRVIEGEPDTADEPSGGGLVWNIRTVTNPDQHKRWLELRCTSGTAS